MNEIFWLNVKKTETCWNWTGLKTKGYGRFWDRELKKIVRAHRFAWSYKNGPIPDGMVVMHSCDNPSCVNPSHLSIGTQTQNLEDARAKDRHYHRLTSLDVDAIRSLRGTKSSRELAKEYGTCQTNICAIWNGVNWKSEAPCAS